MGARESLDRGIHSRLLRLWLDLLPAWPEPGDAASGERGIGEALIASWSLNSGFTPA